MGSLKGIHRLLLPAVGCAASELGRAFPAATTGTTGKLPACVSIEYIVHCQRTSITSMSKSCQGLLTELVKCLRESDCYKARVLYAHHTRCARELPWHRDNCAISADSHMRSLACAAEGGPRHQDVRQGGARVRGPAQLLLRLQARPIGPPRTHPWQQGVLSGRHVDACRCSGRAGRQH